MVVAPPPTRPGGGRATTTRGQGGRCGGRTGAHGPIQGPPSDTERAMQRWVAWSESPSGDLVTDPGAESQGKDHCFLSSVSGRVPLHSFRVFGFPVGVFFGVSTFAPFSCSDAPENPDSPPDSLFSLRSGEQRVLARCSRFGLYWPGVGCSGRRLPTVNARTELSLALLCVSAFYGCTGGLPPGPALRGLVI